MQISDREVNASIKKESIKLADNMLREENPAFSVQYME